MKQLYLIALFLTGIMPVTAQINNQDPLPPEAFDRMIVQDLTYAIVGENTPVSGLKVDISKPEGTISGMFPIKSERVPWDIFSFELKGGVTDKNFSFLKGLNAANSTYEVRPSFHFITRKNSATFGVPAIAQPNKKIVGAKNSIVDNNAASLIDTVYVVTMLYNRHLGLIDSPKPTPGEIAAVSPTHKAIAAHIIRKILKNPGMNIDLSGSIDAVISNLPQASQDANGVILINTYYDDVIKLYKKYKKIYAELPLATLDKKIANASDIWTLKKYFWWTATPFLRTEKVNEFYTSYKDIDSMYFKADYRWYYGLSVNANRYWVYPNEIAILLRGSITLSHNNNLATLTSYNYETRSPFFAYNPSVTEKTKSGSAYNNGDIKTGFDKQIGLDLYILPLESLVPGFYASGTLSHSNLYELPNVIGRADDKIKIGAESGLIFNINNREKDKTILSILTYFRYEDITDERRIALQTGIQESKEDFQKRNISIGLKVGIPITLPQRTN